MNEENHIHYKHGKWSQKNVPHKGWACIDIEDTGELSTTCEMCESQSIRYIHYMQHEQYPEVLAVGCVCAGNMESDLIGARQRDDLMRSRVQKKKRWLTRRWKISRKGNEFLVIDGFVISIFEKNGKWHGSVQAEDGTFKKYSRKTYADSDRVKLAAFDLVTKQLFDRRNI